MKDKKAAHKAETELIEFRPLIHIVFQEADIKVLEQAMELDENLKGDIIIIRDDYAVGPLHNLDTTEGWQQRRDWWKELIDFSPYNTDELMDMVNDRMAVHNLKKKLSETNCNVWMWVGQNQHDVCGYFWLISQLKEFAGSLFILFMNNLPFLNDQQQLFFPKTIHQIPPKEFVKAKKLARTVTLSEFEVDPDEWTRLCQENGMVRILEGGKKIISKTAFFYDDDILKVLGTEWMKGNKAMFAILGKMKIKTGDVFLLWRIKKLAEEGKLQLKGNPAKGWPAFEVKLLTETSVEV